MKNLYCAYPQWVVSTYIYRVSPPSFVPIIIYIFTTKTFINPVLLIQSATSSLLRSSVIFTQHLQHAFSHLPNYRGRDGSVCDVCVRWLFQHRRALGQPWKRQDNAGRGLWRDNRNGEVQSRTQREDQSCHRNSRSSSGISSPKGEPREASTAVEIVSRWSLRYSEGAANDRAARSSRILIATTLKGKVGAHVEAGPAR